MGEYNVDWAAFSWDAFATLATGFAAVFAAFLVGRRQAAISDRQNQILDRQMLLSELSLRSDLFDRRFACYERVRFFLGRIIAHADRPEHEVQADFLTALNESKFLFRQDVHGELKEIWREACTYFAVHAETKATYKREGHYGPKLESEHELLLKLTKRIETLADVFGDELKLSASPLASAGAPARMEAALADNLVPQTVGSKAAN